jgi:hypothetical protein
VELYTNGAESAAPGCLGNSVSSVSWVFPRLGNTFSAYLCGIRESVSMFPVFPCVWRVCVSLVVSQ